MAIGRSLAYIFSGATAIADLPDNFGDIVYTSVLGIPANVLTLLVLYGVAWAYLNLTKGGRTIYAIGSNREAARTAGLNVLAFSILPYVIAGGLAAVAITFSSAQVMSIDPVAGTGLELDAIAAVVIGGSSLYGGRGSIFGTLIGVLIMVMIRNGLNLLNVSPFWQGSAIGAVIIAAVLIERLLSTRVFLSLNLNLTSLFPMPEAISDSIRLYGTDEPVEPPRILRAGPLTVEFEAGNLRHIRYHGREMIRAVSFVVRDKNWGTYAPQIGRLHFHEEPEMFRVSYEATVKEGEEEFRYLGGNRGPVRWFTLLLRKRNGDIGFSHQSDRFCRAPSD